MYAYENIYMHMFTNESSISCLVSNVSLSQIPSRPWITLEIEETRAFDVTDQTDPNVTDEV